MSENTNKKKLTFNVIIRNLFTGRMNRLEYFLGFLLLLLPFFLIGILILVISLLVSNSSKDTIAGNGAVIYLIIFCLGYFVSIISVHIRRWHDLDKSGFLTFLLFIPVINIIAALILLFMPGDNTSNKFGDKPNKILNIKKIFGFSN